MNRPYCRWRISSEHTLPNAPDQGVSVKELQQLVVLWTRLVNALATTQCCMHKLLSMQLEKLDDECAFWLDLSNVRFRSRFVPKRPAINHKMFQNENLHTPCVLGIFWGAASATEICISLTQFWKKNNFFSTIQLMRADNLPVSLAIMLMTFGKQRWLLDATCISKFAQARRHNGDMATSDNKCCCMDPVLQHELSKNVHENFCLTCTGLKCIMCRSKSKSFQSISAIPSQGRAFRLFSLWDDLLPGRDFL